MNYLKNVSRESILQNNCPNVTIRSKKRSPIFCRTLDREYLSSDSDTPRASFVLLNTENKNVATQHNQNTVSTNLYPILNSGDATSCLVNSITKDTQNDKKLNTSKNLEDLENELIELNLNDDFDKNYIMNELDPLELQIRNEISTVNIDVLRQKLKERKCSIGPINNHNRKLYENKFVKLEVERRNGNDLPLKSMFNNN